MAESQPPDLTKGKHMEARPMTGTVVRTFLERGFGFIKPDGNGPDLFFHFSNAVGVPPVGGKVEFEETDTDKGPAAIAVRQLN